MRQSSGISVLPADLHQQLLAMPLTADERQEAAQAIMKFTERRKIRAFCHSTTENAPQPDWLRGV